ncbi:MAG: hypothetical protein K9H48_07965 [Melioribacteraceae bacterium]|nr:hypothetical protein [Melioribacteraceae bacterium]
MVKIYTSQYKYDGNDRIDITSRSKDDVGNFFSPPWSLVDSYKRGLIGEKEYTDHYMHLMRVLYKRYKYPFNEILKKNELFLFVIVIKMIFVTERS